MIVGAEGVLGWSVGGEWKTLDDGPVPAAEGDVYRIVHIGEPITSVAGPAPGEGCEITDTGVGLDLGMVADTWPFEFPVAVSADWDLVPQPIEMLSSESRTYKEAVSEILNGLGIDDPDPHLTVVMRTDLEGDGIDEILVGAERNPAGDLLGADPGDYSILLLRKLIEGDVQSAILAFHEVVGDGGDFGGFLSVVRFAAVADLNGDGRMEIAYTDQYYEGSSTIVVEYVDDDLGPVEVLSVGCGA